MDSVKTVQGDAGAGLAFPCNVDTFDDTERTGGRVSAVPSLGFAQGGSYLAGAVGLFSEAGKLLSTIEVAQLIGHLGHQ